MTNRYLSPKFGVNPLDGFPESDGISLDIGSSSHQDYVMWRHIISKLWDCLNLNVYHACVWITE